MAEWTYKLDIDMLERKGTSACLAATRAMIARIRELEAELERASQPGSGEADAMRFLNEEDHAVLFQFYEQATDFEAGGYTASKEDMKRLAELGVVNSKGFGRYEVTSFGAWIVETTFSQRTSLPLKTIAEYNADAARASLDGRREG